MFKSIFSKYFTIIGVVIALSFVLLGGTQTLLSARYWTSDKRETLCNSADTIADHMSRYVHKKGDGYVIEESFRPLFALLSETDASLGRVLVTTAGGKVLLSTSDTLTAATLPAETVERIRDNTTAEEGWFVTGTLGDMYEDGQYTGVAGVVYDQKIVAYVLVSSPMDTLMAYLGSNLQVFFWSALTVLALTFAAMYVMTYRFVRPLREMAQATRQFAKGDFSCRLKVYGRDEVAELAASLNSMAVSLSSVEEMRRSFVGNVSHELKTPMTTISGFIDGILDGTIPPEKHAYYLRIVSDEVKRLSRLVKSMLDLSRIDSGAMKITPVEFDLVGVVANTLLSFEQRLEQKQVTVEGLESADRCFVQADFDLIGQVVYNLVDNATKFIDQGGTLTLSIGEKDGRVSCCVRNTGAGIAAPEMPHIFERFYKSDSSRSLDKKGVGLGLYIVKNVINLHGGEILVRSVEGAYCEFEFWLPAGHPEPPAPHA